MVDRSRFFENKYGNYDGKTALLGEGKELIGKISDDIKSFLTSQLHMLQSVFRKPDLRDTCVYTGTSGIVLLAQKIFTSNNEQWNGFLAFHDVLLGNMSLQKQSITFLCGDAGPLVIHIINCNNKGDYETMQKYASELLKYASWSSDRKLDNEVLYGRAGYLYALLLVKQVNNELVPDNVVQQIVNDLIDAGLKGVNKKSVLPLHYEWYNEEYIGAAHGYVGIFYMLLQANIICPGSLSENHQQLVVSCLDGLLNQRFPSGNLRPAVGDDSDRLIHWCHGAPGAIHLYALAYKIYNKPSYLSACKDFADAVWSRGLLKRGYGICHGVAGNGYALLCMYQLTGEKEYLWRTIKFAEWCLSYGQHGCRTPDTPYSLFEGLAGTLYFLHDILMPESAMFPAFQLVAYS